MQMDTDSMYLAFRDSVKTDMRSSYDRALLSFCNEEDAIDGSEEDHWLARTCCRRHNTLNPRFV